jgi:hypothetical protein
MKDLLNEYSSKYINGTIKTKFGYCQRCLKEKWRNASENKILYQYTFNNKEIYVCSDHIGCLEIGTEISNCLKPLNDIEKRKFKNGLKELIKDGEELLNKY